MRDPEIQKYLSVLTAMVSVIAAGLSLFAFEFETFDGFNDGHLSSQVFAASVGLTGSVVASLLYLRVIRRGQLRRRARRVFIIYPRENLTEARSMAELLSKNGVEPWLDVDEISAGEVWQDVIAQGLDESAMAVVLLTSHSASSEFVKSEVRAAIHNLEARDKKTSPIIPVLYEGGEVPSSLKHIHYVDMTEPKAQEFLMKSIFRAMDRVVADGLSEHK